jgi:hypothetical protein
MKPALHSHYHTYSLGWKNAEPPIADDRRCPGPQDEVSDKNISMTMLSELQSVVRSRKIKTAYLTHIRCVNSNPAAI